MSDPVKMSPVAAPEGWKEQPTAGEPVQVLPDDEHNRALVANVHPSEWTNPSPAPRYNLVVVGAGTAGLVTAAGAAGLGAKVALVEKHLMGGDCLNVGCVPSKALVRASRAAADVRDAGQFGVHIPGEVAVDFPAVMQRMRRMRAQISPHDSAARFRDLGIDVFLGAGIFNGLDAVQVGEHTLRFRKAVIATGARAVPLPIPGLVEAGYLTNETVFSLTELPRQLAVIGAGPIGCEMAQAFARFGSEVHLLEVMPQILTREDQDAASLVEAAMVRDGVKVVRSCNIREVKSDGEQKHVVFDCGGECQEVTFDAILVGVGRAPNVQGLGLEAAGVEYDERQGVSVDDRLRTSNPRIYAAGDICSVYKFTHAADAMARIVIQNALFLGRSKVSALTIPWCTYTDPEIAHVGMYARDAESAGIAVNTFVQPLLEVDRAILDGETGGFVKVHVKRGTDHILGATIVAPHAGEMISEVSVAITAGIGLKQLAKTIHPYPTQAEAIKKVADAYNRTRLTPWVTSLFQKWLAWTR